MDLNFTGEIVYWRGPSPFYFVPVADDEAEDIQDLSRDLTYGWGCIPVTAKIGRTTFTTSLFPKDGGYLVPVKVAVRKAEKLELGQSVAVRLTMGD